MDSRCPTEGRGKGAVTRGFRVFIQRSSRREQVRQAGMRSGGMNSPLRAVHQEERAEWTAAGGSPEPPYDCQAFDAAQTATLR